MTTPLDSSLPPGETASQVQNLHEAHQRMETTLIATDVGTWLYDIQENRVYGDRNMLRLSGLWENPDAEVGAEDYFAHCHPDDLDLVKAALKRTLETGARYTAEYRVRQPDGSVRWVLARGILEYDKEGRAAHLPGVLVDVTDRVEAEQARTELTKALSRQERMVQALLSAIPDFAYVFDLQARFIYANQALLNLWGMELPEVVGKSCLELQYTPELAASVERQVFEVIATGQPLRDKTPYTSPTGVSGCFEHIFSPILAADGSVELVAGTSRDITDRELALTALQRSEAMFRQLADTMPQLAWMATPNGHIFWYNRRWYEYTGKVPEEMEGWGWRGVHDPDVLPHVLQKWQASIDTGTPFDMTFPLLGKDQVYRPFLTRVMPLRNENEEIVFWFGTNTDISEQRRMLQEREELLASERTARSTAEHASRMKDEFLATLSHELRTPLNAIFGWTQLVKGGGADDEETILEAIDVIDRNVRVQTQLIDDLLDMSRIISGKLRLNMGLVNIVECIEAAMETVQPSAQAKQIKIENSFETADLEIPGDASRFQQIFWNLLSNAIKFTPKGGRVAIRLDRVESHIEIRVADDGLGIEEEFLPHVFDRFRQADASTTRKHGGLGLGLAIVKQLVELHGGHIRAESAGLEQGTTFVVYLPITAVQTTRDFMANNGTSDAGLFLNANIAGLKILVVDDEKDAREIVRRVLIDQNAVVTTASSVAEAMAMLRESPPDVLISDIGMPEVDGYEFLRRVREREKLTGGRIPAVALTAFAHSEDRTRALLAGYLAHVSKPVETAELVATIAAVSGRTWTS